MRRQHYEQRLACALTDAFTALIGVVAKGRWGSSPDVLRPTVPPPGHRYAQQRGKVQRRGQVIACLRPVAITLQEKLLDPPCCVQLRLHWRLEPTATGASVVLDVRYSLNGAATLRRKHWDERIHGHCARLLAALAASVRTSGNVTPFADAG